MAKTRFPYGSAYGYRNQYNVPAKGSQAGMAGMGTAGVITTTNPDLSVGDIFYTNTNSALNIDRIDHKLEGGIHGCEHGRIVRIMFLDNSSKLIYGHNIVLAGSGDFGYKANSYIDLMHVNSTWYEINRSQPGSDFRNTNMAGTTNQSANAEGVSTIIITGTAAALTVQSLSGGYIGQKVSVILASTNGISYTVNTTGNLDIIGTNALVISNGGVALEFLKYSATTWVYLGGLRS